MMNRTELQHSIGLIERMFDDEMDNIVIGKN